MDDQLMREIVWACVIATLLAVAALVGILLLIGPIAAFLGRIL